MSLNNCLSKINKAKTVFDETEIKSIRALVNQNLGKMPESDAEMQAVQTLLDEAMAARQELSDFIREAANMPVAEKSPEITPKAQFADNKLFTQSAVDAARARLKKKLGNINSGIDPELLQDGMTLAGAHIEAGARSFASFSKAMIEDIGLAIKPYLRSLYESMRHYPGLDSKGMTPAAEIDALNVEPAKADEVKDAEPAKKNGDGPHFAEGQAAFNLGLPRVLPSYFTTKTGKNPKDWYRGWDAANINAKPNAIVATDKDLFVGRNSDGVALYADKNGVRSYMSTGIKIQEPVAIIPGRGAVFDSNNRRAEFKTVEELGGKAESSKPTDKFTTPTVIDKIVSRLAGDGYKSIMDARGHLMELTGDVVKAGTAEAKRADEALELAAVVRAREIVTAGENNGNTSLEIYNKLVDLYENKMPNLNVRTSTSVEQMAYSTPTPLAYLASRLAGINKNTVVAEPTAGNGALLIATNAKLVFANELNADRAAALRSQGYANVSEQDGTKWSPGQEVDAVIANPPFGVIRDDNGETISFQVNQEYKTNEIDHAIALKTLESMKDDGTAVLILGGVNSEKSDVRSDAYNSKAKRAFYFTLYRDYNVTDHFTVSGDMYAKQGAAWPVDVIVIKGRGKSALELPAANVPRIINNYAELGKELNNELTTKDSTSVGITAGQRAGKPAGHGADSAAVQGSRDGGRAENAQQSGAMPRPRSNTERTDSAGNRGNNEAANAIPDSAKPSKRNDTEQSSPGLKRAETKSEAETAGQIHYVPTSQTNNIGTLVPKNMGTAITAALTDLEKRVGNIDKYVAEKLDYKLNDLSKNFSAEQVDALGLAIDNIHNGGGFIIGDQTGVGKGRIVAGLIKYAILNGKTPIFVTEKPNLYGDMMRDLTDIGMHDVNPFMTNSGEEIPLDQDASNWLDEKAIAKENGESVPPRYGKFLKTPANTSKIMQGMMINGSLGAHRAIFTTYSQMQTVKGARTERQDFLDLFSDGAVVIFDESHNAGGTEVGGRGKKPAEGDMPEGRSGFARAIAAKAHGVFYSSATYAKRPSVMSLYFRTSMAKAVKNIKELSGAISAGGVPLQQVVATMLAKAGQYMRRERSFAGVEYNVKESVVDKKIAEDASTIFRAINKFDGLKKVGIKAMHEQAKKEAKQVTENGMAGSAGVESQNFTSVLHNNISQLLLALKAKDAVEKSLEALNNGERVVLTLANTMGSFIEEYVTDHGLKSGDPIDLSYSDLLLRYLEKARMITIKDPFGNSEKRRLTDDEMGPQAANFWHATREQIIGMDFSGLPISPIDYVKSELAKAGYKTGEITGRLHTIDYSGKTPVYRQRPAAEKSIAGRMGMISKFNNGEHDAIVLNQSGATGLSLHASEKFKDKRKRHMIIMQAEANIDTHMQMLGRVHRTGQVITPRYTQLAADIPSEKRPASVLAKKMASLNANTTASAKSALTAEDSLDFMNSYGDEVAFELMQNDPLLNDELGEPSDGDTKEDVMRKVTGRIPLLPLAKQAAVYKQLEDAYKELIASHDALGTNKLEAKTLDTDAKTKSKTMVFSSAQPGELTKVSDNPFEQDAYAELVDMKKQGRAYTSQQVIDMLKLELGSEANDLGSLRALGEQKAKLMRQEFDAEYKDYSAEYLNDISAERVQAARERLYAQQNEVVNLLNGIRTGSPAVANLDGNLIKGIVIKVEHKQGPKNPAALGAWKVSLALADGMRHITIPLSQLTHGYQTPMEDKKHIAVIRDSGEATLKLFDTAQTSSREERTIITGNILAGFGKFKGGQIVHFTDDKGDMRQGILMPAKFNLEETLAGEPVPLTPDQVAQFLTEGNDRLVSNESEIIKATRNRNGEYILAVPSSKAEGGVFFLNKKLLGVLGQDFIKTGNSMRVTLDSKSQLIAALNVLQEMNQTFITKSFKDEAKKIAGIKDKSNLQAKFSRGESSTYARKETVQRTADALVQGMTNAPDIITVQSAGSLPFSAPSDARGAFWRGNIYLVADNLGTRELVRETLAHEMMGHYGLHGFFGAELNAALVNIHTINPRVRTLAAEWISKNGDLIKEWRKEYGTKINIDKFARMRAIEEAMSEIAQTGKAITGMQKFAALVQKLLRKIGLGKLADMLEAKTDAEAMAMLKKAEMFVRNGTDRDSVATSSPFPAFMTAWHGSPHDHDKFDSSKIGTGEGAQAYGHGLYFAGNKKVAEYYKATLSIDKGLNARIMNDAPNSYSVWGLKNKGDQQISMLADKLLLGEAHKFKDKWDKENSGKLYQVELAPAEDEYLLWDKPLSEQSAKVKAALEKAGLFDGSGKAESDYADRYAQAVKKEGGNADAVKQAILNLVRNKEMSDKDWNIVLRENPQPKGFDLNDIHDEYRPTYWRSVLNRTTMERETVDATKVGETLYREIDAALGQNTESAGALRDIIGISEEEAYKTRADALASKLLHAIGIRGIKYLDGSSRSKGDGDFNYVIFDDADVEITAKFSRANAASNPGKDPVSVLRPAKKPTMEQDTSMLDHVLGGKFAFQIADSILTKSGAKRLAGGVYTNLLERVGAESFADLIPETVKAGLVSDYGLTPEYSDRKAEMKAAEAAQNRKSAGMIEMLAGLTRAESRVAYQWMQEKPDTATENHLLAQLPQGSREVLGKLKSLVTELGKEAVRLGQLSPEAFERNSMAYLNRTYAKHVIGTEGKIAAFFRARALKIKGNQYKGRGIFDEVTMNAVGGDKMFWRKLVEGRADNSLKGEKLIRFERRDASTEVMDALPGMTSKPLGKLREIVYWPESQPVPAKLGDWVNAGTFEVRGTKGDKLVVWRDFTREERTRMGELDEVRYAVAQTLQAMSHDIEIGRFFEWNAKKYGKIKLPDGVEEVKASEAMYNTFGKDDWVQVPSITVSKTTTKKYGALAGMYMPGPIWNDIRQVGGYKPSNPILAEHEKALQFFKKAKTAWSPAVHMNNVMANFVIADWHDLKSADLAEGLKVWALKNRPGYKEIYERFEDSGALGGMFLSNEALRDEIAKQLEEMKAELTGAKESEGELSRLSKLIHLVTMVGMVPVKGAKLYTEKMEDAYQFEDAIFRLASFVKAIRYGKSDIEAGRIARHSFLNYDINAPWVQMARHSFLPFISFFYRAMPMLASTVKNKPWKVVKLLAFYQAASMIGALLAGSDDDDEERNRKLMPEGKEGNIWGIVPKMIRMGWNHGDAPVYLDVRRWVPVGDVVDLGQTSSDLPSWLTPGGILPLLAEVFVFNKSVFMDKNITGENDSFGEAAEKKLDYLFKGMLPNVPLPNPLNIQAGDVNFNPLGLEQGSFQPFSWSGIEKSVNRTENAIGEVRSTPAAFASSFGIKVAAYPKENMAASLALEFKRDSLEIEGKMKSIARDYAKLENPSHKDTITMERKITVQAEKIQKAADRLAEKLQ